MSKAKVMIYFAPRERAMLRSVHSLHDVGEYSNKVGIKTVLFEVADGTTYSITNAQASFGVFLDDPTMTHWFCAADDLLYPQNILEIMIGRDKDVIGALYRKRIVDQCALAIFLRPEDNVEKCLEEKRAVETDFVGGHTLLVKRKVLEAMAKEYTELKYKSRHREGFDYGFFMPMIINETYYDDDFAFSLRARELGFKLWLDFAVRCSHEASTFLGIGD